MSVLGSKEGGVKNSGEGGFVTGDCWLQAVCNCGQERAGLEGEDTDEEQSSESRFQKVEDVQPHIVREEEMQDAQG